ncbi:hypothetical protein BC829DRAFT_395708 [Chytridium lagenaria]|nr:hypothetical protein BC829DRAFT_395708 [Chytridium lagenaria]
MDIAHAEKLAEIIYEALRKWLFLGLDQKYFIINSLSYGNVCCSYIKRHGVLSILNAVQTLKDGEMALEVFRLLHCILQEAESQTCFCLQGQIQPLLDFVHKDQNLGFYTETFRLLIKLLDNHQLDNRIAKEVLAKKELFFFCVLASDISFTILTLQLLEKLLKTRGKCNFNIFLILSGGTLRERHFIHRTKNIISAINNLMIFYPTSPERQDDVQNIVRKPSIVLQNVKYIPEYIEEQSIVDESADFQTFLNVIGLFIFQQVELQEHWLHPFIKMLNSDDILARSEAVLSLRPNQINSDDLESICKNILPCFEEEEENIHLNCCLIVTHLVNRILIGKILSTNGILDKIISGLGSYDIAILEQCLRALVHFVKDGLTSLNFLQRSNKRCVKRNSSTCLRRLFEFGRITIFIGESVRVQSRLLSNNDPWENLQDQWRDDEYSSFGTRIKPVGRGAFAEKDAKPSTKAKKTRKKMNAILPQSVFSE